MKKLTWYKKYMIQIIAGIIGLIGVALIIIGRYLGVAEKYINIIGNIAMGLICGSAVCSILKLFITKGEK